jgi:hypothetical protein
VIIKIISRAEPSPKTMELERRKELERNPEWLG